MTGDEIEFEGRKFTQRKHDIDPQGLEKFHDVPNLSRCAICWNLEPVCRCARDEAYTEPAEEILAQMISQLHPSVARPTVAGIDAKRRDQLLDAYSERGIRELERLVNGELS